MNTLPEELYDLIARSTEDSDLPLLALVSKAWYRKHITRPVPPVKHSLQPLTISHASAVPARRCTMWTVWGSDSAARFSRLLTEQPQLAPLVRALVVDRLPRPKVTDWDANPAADMMNAIVDDMDRMADAGFILSHNYAGSDASVPVSPASASASASAASPAPAPAPAPAPQVKAESMHLFELALTLVGQCPLLQRFFLLALPGYWTNMLGTADPAAIERQQLRLVAAVARLDQLVVCGLWDEGNVSPVQLGFPAFRRLLETGPSRLRNISWPVEGPLEEGDLVWGDQESDDDAPRPLAATDRRAAQAKDADLSPLPRRQITDVQLTLFHLSLAHYELIAASVFASVKRAVLDISASPNCIPGPEVMRLLFDGRSFGDGLEWFSADVACLPATSNPLALGVRPRFPCLCLDHDGGVYSTMGYGPLGDSDKERFTALKDNSVIQKGLVWQRSKLEKILGPLEVLLPGVELVDL